MNIEEQLAGIREQLNVLSARQTAMKWAVLTLSQFISRDHLLTEVFLQQAADQEAAAMQQDGSADALLPAFLAAIDEWHDQLRQTEQIFAASAKAQEKPKPT